MLTLDRGHLDATARAALLLDDVLRARDHASPRRAAAAAPPTVDEIRARLVDQGDYRARVVAGRLGLVRKILARVARPIVGPQTRYNLILAEHVARLEAEIRELRAEVVRLRESRAS